MSRFPSSLSDRCGKNLENVFHGNPQHARPRKADQGQIFDNQYFWSVRVLHPSTLSPKSLVEVYGDPEVHPQHED